MAKLQLNGDFDFFLGELIDSFNGGVARGSGTGFSTFSSFPYGSSLGGSGMFFETSGPEFVRGTVTSVTVSELSLNPTTVTDKIEFTDVRFAAADVFELVSRTSTGSSGRFLEDEFLRIIDGYTFNVTGSAEDDIAGNGNRLSFKGNDTFHMGGGDDAVFAGKGRDKLFGGQGRDKLYGEGGADRLFGGGGSDKLSGGSGRDRLLGSAGHDTLNGGSGNDRLAGGNGRDILNGGSGRDFLDGGRGRDRLAGGDGADTFVFAAGYGRDVVTQFERGTDTLRLDAGLWSGSKDAAEVVEEFGRITSNGALLNFGDGDVILLKTATSLDGLADDLVLV